MTAPIDAAGIVAAIVKPLVWKDHDSGSSRADVYSVKPSYGQGPEPFFMARASNILGWFDDRKAAQAAAEQDYRARIAAALDVDKLVALVEAARQVSFNLHHGNGLEAHYQARDKLDTALAAFLVTP